MFILPRHLRAIISRRACCKYNYSHVCSRHLGSYPGPQYDSPRRIARLTFSPARPQSRDKRTITKSNVEDLAPAFPAVEPLPSKDDGLALPTVLLQARNNMRKFESCVLLTRVGGFYELYFEHADDFGPLMNLKVASKKAGDGHVSMVFAPSYFDMLSNT